MKAILLHQISRHGFVFLPQCFHSNGLGDDVLAKEPQGAMILFRRDLSFADLFRQRRAELNDTEVRDKETSVMLRKQRIDYLTSPLQ